MQAPQLLRTTVFTALLLGGMMSAQAADKLHVSESVSLKATPEKVWDLIGNFVALPAWHPAVASTTIVKGNNNEVGSQRNVVTKDGAKLLEELKAYDATAHSMSYNIVSSPLPVTDYLATLSVKADGEGAIVTWEGDFNRDPKAADVDDEKVKGIVQGIYKSGLDGLHTQMTETATPTATPSAATPAK